MSLSGYKSLYGSNVIDAAELTAATTTLETVEITTSIDLSSANISGIDTDDVTEATNLYYTEARVSANTSVASNTTHRGVTTGNPHNVLFSDVGIASLGSTDIITTAERNKLSGIEALADVTDTTNVTSAGALMLTGGTMTGAIVFNAGQLFDGRDISADGAKLDTIETGADITDTANVTSAGALMLTGGTMTGDIVFNTSQLFDGVDISALNTAVGLNTAKISFDAASSAKVGFISITQAVDLDTMESNISTNNAKISFDAASSSKLSGIEALADVTDATNVSAAGALMLTGGTMSGSLDMGSNTITNCPYISNATGSMAFDADDYNFYDSSDIVFLSKTGGGNLILDVCGMDISEELNIGGSKISTGSTKGLQLYGANINIAGPHIQAFTSTDNYPLYQMLNWQHDAIYTSFDAYFDGSSWRSSDAGSNFQIRKGNDSFNINYDSGIAQGSAVTWNTGFSMDTSGNITVGGTVDGRDISADGSKLDGIETGADVTDTTNVSAAGALMLTGGIMTGDLLLDSSQIRPDIGTTYVPCYGFRNDPNTGMWSSGADTINFSTGGTERLEIDSSGDLTVNGGTVYSTCTNTVPSFETNCSVSTEGHILDMHTTMASTTANARDFRFMHHKNNSIFFQAINDAGVYVRNIMYMQHSGDVAVNGALKPVSDNTHDLGTSGLRWDDIYATNSTIQTSDENQKTNIIESDLGLDFIKELKPKKYRWKNGKRSHYGLIAQDIESVIKKRGIDFAGFVKDSKVPSYDEFGEKTNETKVVYGLRYNEFTAPMIRAIQELNEKIERLEKK